jgi:ribosomal protein S18 acetylase RimI-like enzyme
VNIETVIVNYSDAKQAKDLTDLLDIYARDVMGGAMPLEEEVLTKLPAALSKLAHAFSLLCYVDGEPAGLINCFEAFSTFQCKPLVNIHDIVVAPKFRGLGLSQIMMSRVEEIARAKGCCKITLEVLEGNTVAKNSYAKFGFTGYELDPATGNAMFWHKLIDGK